MTEYREDSEQLPSTVEGENELVQRFAVVEIGSGRVCHLHLDVLDGYFRHDILASVIRFLQSKKQKSLNDHYSHFIPTFYISFK